MTWPSSTPPDGRPESFEELLSAVSSRLVAARADQVDEVLSRCMADIASHFAAQCVVFGRCTEQGSCTGDSRTWTDPALPHGCGASLRQLVLPEVSAALMAQRFVVLDTQAPPPALGDDARKLAGVGVRSCTAAVLRAPGPAIDTIAIASWQLVPHWNTLTARRLHLLGNVLVGAVHHFEAERQVAKEQERYRLLTDHMPGLYSVINADHTYRYVNLAYAKQFGRRRDQIIGRSMKEVVGPLYARVAPAIDRALAGDPQVVEVDLPDSSGGARYLVGHLVPSRNPDGAVDGVLALITDVSDLRAAQRRLQVSQQELQLEHRVVRAFLDDDDAVAYADALDAILEAFESPMGLLGFIDTDGSLVLPSLTRRVWDECRIEDKTTRFPPSAWGGLWGRALQEHRTLHANEGLVVPSGHMPIGCAVFAPVGDAAVPLGLVGVANRKGGYSDADVARLERVAGALAPIIKGRQAHAAAELERATLQKQLVQAQKMEAVGRLAGGVAHDFNNILQAIVGYGGLITAALPRDHAIRSDLDEVLLAAERAKSLVRQLLIFSRQRPAHVVPTDLGALLQGLTSMLRRIIGEDVELVVDVGPSPLTARVDPGQIEQVVVNLAVNARDAMPHGGKLQIELSEIALDSAALQSSPWTSAGRFARMSMLDTGTGISEHAREHLFEPFFTTKDVGKGTGLGLATVYAILKDHGGIITASNEPARGARFDVYLPIAADAAVEPGMPSRAQDVGPTGTETILLAEDDSQVRRFAVAVLRGAGYRVFQAGDGAAAKTMFSRFHEQIDLAVLDVVMPGESGAVVYDHIRTIAPDFPVLFTSGYDQDLLADRLSARQRDGLLHKPFSSGELLARVREVLDRATHASTR